MADKARKAEVIRETKETRIRVTVDVDGSGKSTISTGVGFFEYRRLTPGRILAS